MAAEGREVVLRMLADTGAAMTRDPDVALLVDLLASTGYAATPAPLEELRVAERAASGGEDGRSAAVTPLLPELYVRTRRVGADGAVEEALDKPRVALQVLRAEDVLRCAADPSTVERQRAGAAGLGVAPLLDGLGCSRAAQRF